MKPILFNTESMKNIQKMSKMVTIRCIYGAYQEFDFTGVEENPKRIFIKNNGALDKSEKIIKTYKGTCATFQAPFSNPIYKFPYLKDDILYVKEAWNCFLAPDPLRGTTETYCYKADGGKPDDKWYASVYMPREAARIFLKVTDIQVKRLHDVTKYIQNDGDLNKNGLDMGRYIYPDIWNSKINPKDRPDYGWDANPWVWVIKFEKISKDDALKADGGMD